MGPTIPREELREQARDLAGMLLLRMASFLIVIWFICCSLKDNKRHVARALRYYNPIESFGRLNGESSVQSVVVAASTTRTQLGKPFGFLRVMSDAVREKICSDHWQMFYRGQIIQICFPADRASTSDL